MHAGSISPEAIISEQGLVGGHHQQLRVIVLLNILQVAGQPVKWACMQGWYAAGLALSRTGRGKGLAC